MPWLLAGYSKELDALWQKEKPKFFALAEQRRETLPRWLRLAAELFVVGKNPKMNRVFHLPARIQEPGGTRRV
jgi:hypothetical protein